eukprot:a25796_3.p1 GENE.a25796_3~~a25796_3.p1  ORF type:complete len:346 (-),score=116.38 a25796_3:38-997(-)
MSSRSGLIAAGALFLLARRADGAFIAFDCQSVTRVPKSELLSRKEVCVSQSILVVLAGLAFLYALSGVYRLVRDRPKWFVNRLFIVLLSAVESAILFVNFGFEAQKSILYIVHFLQNLTLTAVTYHLLSYAAVLARRHNLVPMVILPATIVAGLLQSAFMAYILAQPQFTESSGFICQSTSWFLLAGVGVVLTGLFTYAGVIVHQRIARVAKRSFAAAFLRRKMSKLRNLIVVYLFSAIVSFAFYLAEYLISRHTLARPPCNGIWLEQHSATAVFIEHILVHVVTFFGPVVAFVLQFSTGPYTVEGETIEITSPVPQLR